MKPQLDERPDNLTGRDTDSRTDPLNPANIDYGIKQLEDYANHPGAHAAEDQAAAKKDRNASQQVQDAEKNPGGYRFDPESFKRGTAKTSFIKQLRSNPTKAMKALLKTPLKKWSPAGIAGVVIVFAAAIILGGPLALPAAIVGNVSANSILHGVNSYLDDYNQFMFFGVKGNTQNVGTKAGQLAGLTDDQIDELKAKGVEFPDDGIKTERGKTVFRSVTVDGVEVTADNYKSVGRAVTRKLRVTRPGLWKSTKSFAASVLNSRLLLTLNPRIKADTIEESNKNLVSTSVGDASDSVKVTNGTTEEQPEDTSAKAGDIADTYQDELDASKEAVAEGTGATDRIDTNDVGTTLSREVGDADFDQVIGQNTLGSKIWGAFNTLDIADMVCTVYQTAYTTNTIAKTVALANVVRFGMTVYTALEKNHIGDDDNNQVGYFMDILNTPDPSTGLSFDSSSYAAFLFTGQLSTEPSAVSAYGGQAMWTLMQSMFFLHTAVGSGSASAGRAILKTTCGLATNLGVQIGATVVGAAVTILTGGVATGVSIGGASLAKAGIISAAKSLIKEMVEKFSTKIRNELIEKGLKDVIKDFAKGSLKSLKTLYRNLSGFDKVGLLFAGVATFGTDYLVKMLTGENIVDTMQSGLATMDAVGTAYQNYETQLGIGLGGTMATYSQADNYAPTLASYQGEYIQDQQEDASSTPLDITNPYSALGSIFTSMQQQIGFSNSMQLQGTLLNLPMLGVRGIASIMPTTQAADEETALTAENIGNYIDDPFASGDPFGNGEKLALQITGSPMVIFNPEHSYEEVLNRLAYSSDPQIEVGLTDTEGLGETRLSIIKGTDLYEYQQKCHNPERIEADPTYELDDGSNLYDTECMVGGSEHNQLYSDAIAYVQLTSPDTPTNTTTNSTTTQDGTVSSTGGPVLPLDRKYYDADPSDWLDKHVLYSGTFTSPYEKGLGVDIGSSTAPVGSHIYSMYDGIVSRVNLCGSGDGIVIKSTVNDEVVYVAYGHGTNPQANVGDTVSAGEYILNLDGVGCQVDGAHLHIDMTYAGEHICPQDLFPSIINNSPVDYPALVDKARPGCG